MRYIGFTILVFFLASTARAELVRVSHPNGWAYGVAILPQYVLTCDHCVRGDVTLVYSQGTTRGEVVATDSRRDLALVRIHGADAIVTPLCPRFGRSKLSSAVRSVTLSRTEAGNISSEDVDFFYTTIQLKPGDSGSALLDEQGRLVGIAQAIQGDGSVFAHLDAIHHFLLHRLPEYKHEASPQHPASTGFCFVWIVFGCWILFFLFKRR